MAWWFNETHTRATTNIDPAAHTNIILHHQQEVLEHNNAKNRYKRYRSGLTALTNVILSNIDHKFIEEHNNEWTGFTQVHPFTLLTYINNEYGQVSDDKLTTNENKLNEPWDPTTPIQTLYNHIDECQSFSESRNDPII